MRWYTVKGESSRLGWANAQILFFSFLFSLRCVFSFFFPQEANACKCFPFIIIYARYSCIACIMLLKPKLARSQHSFRNWDNKCFLRFFLNLAVIISSLTASLCFTFAEPFDNIFLSVKSSCALVNGNTNKSLQPKEGRKEWPTDRPTKGVNLHSLNSYFAFCKIVVKGFVYYTYTVWNFE